MSEGELIEMAARFRKLEDAQESADLFLASFNEAAERRIEKAEAAHASASISYSEYCRRTNEPEADIAKLAEVRGDIEKHTEACHADMVAMQEFIRKCAK